jgi:hypothetical protein
MADGDDAVEICTELFQKERLGRPYFQELELGLKSDFARVDM